MYIILALALILIILSIPRCIVWTTEFIGGIKLDIKRCIIKGRIRRREQKIQKMSNIKSELDPNNIRYDLVLNNLLKIKSDIFNYKNIFNYSWRAFPYDKNTWDCLLIKERLIYIYQHYIKNIDGIKSKEILETINKLKLVEFFENVRLIFDNVEFEYNLKLEEFKKTLNLWEKGLLDLLRYEDNKWDRSWDNSIWLRIKYMNSIHRWRKSLHFKYSIDTDYDSINLQILTLNDELKSASKRIHITTIHQKIYDFYSIYIRPISYVRESIRENIIDANIVENFNNIILLISGTILPINPGG